jgi:hypothetical protein
MNTNELRELAILADHLAYEYGKSIKEVTEWLLNLKDKLGNIESIETVLRVVWDTEGTENGYE